MSVGGAIGARQAATPSHILGSLLTLSNSVAGAIWRNTLPNKLKQYLPSELNGQANSIFGSIVVAREYAMGTEARYAINRSYREESQRLLAIAGLVSLSLMLIVMLFLKNVKLGEDSSTETEEKDQAHGTAEKETENSHS